MYFITENHHYGQILVLKTKVDQGYSGSKYNIWFSGASVGSDIQSTSFGLYDRILTFDMFFRINFVQYKFECLGEPAGSMMVLFVILTRIFFDLFFQNQKLMGDFF